MRSIYDNPYKYACECDIPIELAKIACLKERHLRKEQKKRDFDVVLYFKRKGQDISGWKKACGATTVEEWQAFARKEIVGR